MHTINRHRQPACIHPHSSSSSSSSSSSTMAGQAESTRRALPNKSREAGPPGASIPMHALVLRRTEPGVATAPGCRLGGARPSGPPTSPPRKVWPGRERMRPCGWARRKGPTWNFVPRELNSALAVERRKKN